VPSVVHFIPSINPAGKFFWKSFKKPGNRDNLPFLVSVGASSRNSPFWRPRETSHFNLYAFVFARQRPIWAFTAKNKTFWGIRFQQLGKFTCC
jgi:hypothetical protein